MNKNILLSLFTVLFLTGCAGVDLTQVSDEDLERLSEKAVVCNAPYIRVGIECCLDENANNICDRDETSKEEVKYDQFEEILDDFDSTDEFEYEDDIGDLLDDENKNLDNKRDKELEYENKEPKYDNERSEYENEELKYKSEGIEVEYDVENKIIYIEWEDLENENMFKYYKVLNSNDDPNLSYPETAAIFVGQDVDKTEFKISTDKLNKGVNYFKVAYVLSNDEVYHTQLVKVIIE